MTPDSQWLEVGLADLPSRTADRIRAFRLLIGTAQSMRALLDRDLAPAGVTTQQAAMASFIESRAEPPRISDVAGAMNMSHQNVKQIAAALERKGFVEIVPDDEDRRARRLVLTAEHRRFWRRRNARDFANVARWTAPLSDDEVATLLGLLARVHAHVSASAAPPPRR